MPSFDPLTNSLACHTPVLGHRQGRARDRNPQWWTNDLLNNQRYITKSIHDVRAIQSSVAPFISVLMTRWMT